MSLPYARAVTSFNFRRPPVIEVAIGIEFVTPAGGGMTSTLLPDRMFEWDRGDPATAAWISAGLRRAPRAQLLAAARRQLSQLLLQSQVPVGRFPAAAMNGLLDAIVRDDQPTPQLFPDGHLGLTCEWLVDGIHLLLTVEGDGACLLVVRRRRGPPGAGG